MRGNKPRVVCCNCDIKLSRSISDIGDCHGYCRFPAFLWQQHQTHETDTTSGWFSSSAEKSRDGAGRPDVTGRRWFERMVYNSAGGAAATWDLRREITARPTEIWTQQRVRTPCASAATGEGQRPGGRMACYRREWTSNVSCLAEEPSGKYRVLVNDADG